MIYSIHLMIPGPTYPLDGKPVSFTSLAEHKRLSQTNTLSVPCSALGVLQVNKQVHNEAYKLFYQNDLVFSTHVDLQIFMFSLSDERLDCLRNLTLFYDKSLASVSWDEVEIKSDLGVTLPFLRRLKGLRKFHLILSFREIELYEEVLPDDFMDPVDVSGLKDAKAMLMLRGVTDLMIIDLDLLDVEEDCRRAMAGSHEAPMDPNLINAQKLIAQQMAALRHFNHGLHLAQTGLVVHELYTEKNWRDKDSWPALQGSNCGLQKGCSCGVKHGEADTDKSVISH
jgi:hypothetical protein